MVYTLCFFPLQNAVCFIILTYLVPVLFTFYIQGVLKLKKNNSGAKRLTRHQYKSRLLGSYIDAGTALGGDREEGPLWSLKLEGCIEEVIATNEFLFLNNQLDAQFFFLQFFCSILYMFRATKCSSSGQ